MKSLLALATHSIPCSSSHAYRVAPFVLVKYATTSKSGRAWIATVSEREISKFRACKTSMQVTAFFANPIRVSLSTYEEEGWVDCLNVLGSSIESGMYMRREPSMHPTRRRDPHNPTLSIFTGQSFRICTKSNALWTMVGFWMCEQAKAMQNFTELRLSYQDAPPVTRALPLRIPLPQFNQLKFQYDRSTYFVQIGSDARMLLSVRQCLRRQKSVGKMRGEWGKQHHPSSYSRIFAKCIQASLLENCLPISLTVF